MTDRLEDGWIDITRPVSGDTPVWPGDVPFSLSQRIDGGLVLSSITTTCHVGTHVDSPRHLDPVAQGVDCIPLRRVVGPAEVVMASAREGTIRVADLPDGWRPRSPRVLIRTDSHPLGAPIDSGFVALDPTTVHWLADHGVETIAIDVPSVDPFESSDLVAHKALVERGLTWIEDLWLGDVPQGRYLLVALPMLLVGADAAPVRAILNPLRDP